MTGGFGVGWALANERAAGKGHTLLVTFTT